MDVYIGALKQEIVDLVLMFDPQIMVEARRLARVQEIAMGHHMGRGINERVGKQAPTATVVRENSYKNALLKGGFS